MINGFQAWNGHAGSTFQWAQGGFDLGWYNWSACDAVSRNGVWWGDAGGTNYGITNFCWYNNHICRLFSIHITMDNGQLWYTGTGTPSSTQLDFWSGAAHEAGHATGFNGGAGCPSLAGHWDGAAGICQNNSGHHTMCPTTFLGTTRDRTTEVHEETALTARY